MSHEVDQEFHYDKDYGAQVKWCWCNDPFVLEVGEKCAMCNADNVEMQMEGYDQVLVSRLPGGEMHLIEWRWSRGER